GWWYVEGEALCDFSPLYLHRALDASLVTLRTEYVDLYQIHDPDMEAIRGGDLFEFLGREKAQGRIRFAGVSVDTVEQGLLCVASGHVDVLQVYYNILDQKPDPELFQATTEAGVGIVVKTPLGRGLLTGKYRVDSSFSEGDFREGWKKEGRLQAILSQVQRVEELVGDRSPTLAQTALRFVLSHPAVSTAIPGAKRPEQAEANAKASAFGPLSDEDLQALKALYKEMAESTSWT
ncbi:MAG: aldo/keto reductase, partial [bacterium]|nr:aldo/keto reductase [bacterium]